MKFVASSESKYEDDVLVMTDKNIIEAVEEFELWSVECHASLCGHCKTLALKTPRLQVFCLSVDRVSIRRLGTKLEHSLDVELEATETAEQNNIVSVIGFSN